MSKTIKSLLFSVCVATIILIAGGERGATASHGAAQPVQPKVQFGEPIPWEKVSELFPRKGSAQIIDFETGRSFSVQRRAGSRHADVQPLTKEDSRTMKEIYDGQWSWRRRAVLVKVGDKFVAASMNGMPHGAGAISGNNFRGHFCVHFNGSSTHKLKKPDPSHQMMIWKASGTLHDVLAAAPPAQMAEIFIAALKEQDLHTLRLTLDQSDKAVVEQFAQKAVEVENIRILKQDNPQPASEGVADNVHIPVRLLVFMQPASKRLKGDVTLRLTRNSASGAWKVDPKPMLEFLNDEPGE